MIFQTTKYYHISILLTFLFILLVPLLSSFLVNISWGFAVLTLGILHGANDLEIISKNFKGRYNNLYIKSIVIYVGVVLMGALFFFTLPAIALIIFVIFSSYHFGEQHWEGRLPMSPSNFFFYVIYGAFIFFLMFTLQYDSVVVVISKISGYQLHFDFFRYSLMSIGVLLLFTMLLKSQSRSHFLREIIIIFLLGGVFYVGSLLFAFAFYFVIWHSIPSLQDQLKYLYGNLSPQSLLMYLKSSMVYWLASLVSLFLVYRYVDFEADYFMPLFFSFLAAITFPHTVVIGLMKHKNG